jgi:predicted nucleic acid-binding protein
MTATAGVKVVDASAIASILFEEPEGQAMATLLTGNRLAAPTILDYEIGNIALKKSRRHPALRDAIIAAYDLYLTLPIDLVAVDRADVLALADRTALTFYDASYLWLAHNLNAELVTLDRRLQAAVT